MTTWSTPQHGSMTWACLSVIGPKTRRSFPAGITSAMRCNKRLQFFCDGVPYNKSCTSGGGDPHPPAASAPVLVRGRHPARCGYSRTAGSDRHLACSREDRPGHAISNLHRCGSHFAQEPGRFARQCFTWRQRRRWLGQGLLCSRPFFRSWTRKSMALFAKKVVLRWLPMMFQV